MPNERVIIRIPQTDTGDKVLVVVVPGLDSAKRAVLASRLSEIRDVDRTWVGPDGAINVRFTGDVDQVGGGIMAEALAHTPTTGISGFCTSCGMAATKYSPDGFTGVCSLYPSCGPED